MEVSARLPIGPSGPNPLATAQVRGGRRSIPANVFRLLDVPRHPARPARTTRGHPRIVRARSWIESLAQGHQACANASLYRHKTLAGCCCNRGMAEPVEESQFK